MTSSASIPSKAGINRIVALAFACLVALLACAGCTADTTAESNDYLASLGEDPSGDAGTTPSPDATGGGKAPAGASGVMLPKEVEVRFGDNEYTVTYEYGDTGLVTNRLFKRFIASDTVSGQHIFSDERTYSYNSDGEMTSIECYIDGSSYTVPITTTVSEASDGTTITMNGVSESGIPKDQYEPVKTVVRIGSDGVVQSVDDNYKVSSPPLFSTDEFTYRMDDSGMIAEMDWEVQGNRAQASVNAAISLDGDALSISESTSDPYYSVKQPSFTLTRDADGNVTQATDSSLDIEFHISYVEVPTPSDWVKANASMSGINEVIYWSVAP